tara:strand:- start:728 stop:898 length:171 start_codon:yes stop_codon:yes gene_type:complete
MSINTIMELIAFPLILITWYLFYDTKPMRKDEIGVIWEEEHLLRRLKIKEILNENN